MRKVLHFDAGRAENSAETALATGAGVAIQRECLEQEPAQSCDWLTPPAPAYLCHCLEITEQDVTEMATSRGLTQLSEVIGCTGAGSGCTACHRAIRRHLAFLNGDAEGLSDLPRSRPSAR